MGLRLLQTLLCATMPGSSFLPSARPWLAVSIPPLLLGAFWISTLSGAWSSPNSIYVLAVILLAIHAGSWVIGLKLPRATNKSLQKLIAGTGLLCAYLLCVALGIYGKQHVMPVSLYHVSATSMLPTLLPNDIIMVDTSTNIQKGDVIVFAHPSVKGMHMIKRINHQQQNRLEVLGDNPKTSVDSRVFGKIDKSSVIGKATLLIRDWRISTIPAKPVKQNLR